jgi:hypothetical protein
MIKHDFKFICYDVNELLDKVDTLSKFMNRLEKQSCKFPEKWSEENYKGKAFEFLINVLIHYSPIDKRINIVDYEPVLKSDYGIDGVGKSHNGKIHTIQNKYRSNSTKILTANKDHISNFVAHSYTKYGTDIDMTIFTTAKDLLEKTNNNMYGGKVRVLGYNEVKKLIDGNLPFWILFKEELSQHKDSKR